MIENHTRSSRHTADLMEHPKYKIEYTVMVENMLSLQLV